MQKVSPEKTISKFTLIHSEEYVKQLEVLGDDYSYFYSNKVIIDI